MMQIAELTSQYMLKLPDEIRARFRPYERFFRQFKLEARRDGSIVPLECLTTNDFSDNLNLHPR